MGSARTLKRRRQRHALRALRRKIGGALADDLRERYRRDAIDRVLEETYDAEFLSGLLTPNPLLRLFR